jgi:hypothetical protein
MVDDKETARTVNRDTETEKTQTHRDRGHDSRVTVSLCPNRTISLCLSAFQSPSLCVCVCVLASVTMSGQEFKDDQFYKTPRGQEPGIYAITSTWRHHGINQHHHALKLTPGEMLAGHRMIAPTINQPPSL